MRPKRWWRRLTVASAVERSGALAAKTAQPQRLPNQRPPGLVDQRKMQDFLMTRFDDSDSLVGLYGLACLHVGTKSGTRARVAMTCDDFS